MLIQQREASVIWIVNMKEQLINILETSDSPRTTPFKF
jgi:hypothetical protein